MAQATLTTTLESPTGDDVLSLETKGRGFVDGAEIGITVAVRDINGGIHAVVDLNLALPAGIAAQIQNFLTSNLEPQMRAAAEAALGVTFA